MKTKRSFLPLFILCVLQSLLVSCASSDRHIAINKQEAAFYYYEQGDYESTKKLCEESIALWKTIKQSFDKHVPDWHIDGNIMFCEKLLKDIPNTTKLDSPAKIPIKIVRNAIFVEALLNDKKQATLLLDTGATVSMISPEMAEQIGIRPKKDAPKGIIRVVGGETIEAPYSHLSKIAVGHAVVNNLKVGVFSVFPGKPWVDGILGSDFLGCFTVIVDHDLKHLRLEN